MSKLSVSCSMISIFAKVYAFYAPMLIWWRMVAFSLRWRRSAIARELPCYANAARRLCPQLEGLASMFGVNSGMAWLCLLGSGSHRALCTGTCKHHHLPVGRPCNDCRCSAETGLTEVLVLQSCRQVHDSQGVSSLSGSVVYGHTV